MGFEDKPTPAAWGVKAGGSDPDIQSALFKQYAEAYGGDVWEAEEAEAMQRVSEHIASTESRAAVCLICLETMDNSAPVWQCHKSCHCMFHLLCIQAWGRQQVQAAAARAEAAAAVDQDRASVKEIASEPNWGCPKCRCEYGPREVPTEYRCMCGKEVDPAVNPWLLPHTCGETCGRPLRSACGHTCVLLCHPGPCPPCPLQVEVGCFCGKKEERRRCRGGQGWSCGGLCGRRMPCGHRCPRRCHAGDCPPCALVGKHKCACAREERSVACSDRTFQCGKVCGLALPCGRHMCQRMCHSGPCGECPHSGARSCPCGKVTYTGLRCDEEAQTCGETCGKLLPCGKHTCAERCHTGPCNATCRAMVSKNCACGKSTKTLPCCEVLRCEKKCPGMRACGRHPCRRRCCNGNCPPCDAVCGRKLHCGNHLCPAPCHPGPCLPCPLTATCTCACGKTQYALPCGSEGRAVPPMCHQPCPVPRTCRHAADLAPHRCHFGACPPCPYPCGTSLGCGHTCGKAGCHDPVPAAVAAFQVPRPPLSERFASARKAASPAVAIAPAQQVAEEARKLVGKLSSCPPCRVAVPVDCLGGHTVAQLACSEALPFCCRAKCGQALACGNHTCQLTCHLILPGGEACQQCERPCSKKQACGHDCPLSCHPGPCPSCELQTTRACFCGRSIVEVSCHALHQAMERGEENSGTLLCCGKRCHKALPHCTHVCQEVCHPGPCQGTEGCVEGVVVRCPCRRLKAKWSCLEVRQRLAAEGGAPEYDANTVLRLLPCTADCHAAREAKQKAESATGAKQTPLAETLADSQAHSADQATKHEQAERRPRTREDRKQREALREQEHAKMLVKKKWRDRWLLMKWWLQRLAFVGLVAFLVWFFVWAARTFSAKLGPRDEL